VKTVTIEDFRTHPDQYLTEAAQQEVVFTQDGEPWMVLRSVEHDQDRLSAAYADSPEFWQMIQDRRREAAIPWDEARKQLDLAD
jgi:hypothetical protein